MRAACLSMLLMALAAQAGTLDQCRQKAADNDGVRSCVEAEKFRSNNQLRETGLAAQASVKEQIQAGGPKSLAKELRSMQAHHVRDRAAACRKQAGAQEKAACEADMNFAQVERLARFRQP